MGALRRSDPFDETWSRLREILSLAIPDEAAVVGACDALRLALPNRPEARHAAALAEAAAVARQRGDGAARPLHRLLLTLAETLPDPWPLLRELTCARDAAAAREALVRTAELAERGTSLPGREVLVHLAARAERGDGPAPDPGEVEAAARILGGIGEDAHRLFREEPDPRIRRLAAGVLDLDGRPAPAAAAREVLGETAARFLAPYFEYTRATHRDLVALAGSTGSDPPSLPSLRETEEACGPDLLRRVVAAVGWPRLSLGLEARRMVGVSMEGSLPFWTRGPEAALLDGISGARRVSDPWLFFAHGGRSRAPVGGGAETIERFRSLNRLHAEALDHLLDPAPLTRERALAVLDILRRIVAGFTELFSPHRDEECRLVTAVHRALDRAACEGLERECAAAVLSPELTRRIRTFEDPSSPGAVGTLHGLKRYLHQRGLTLGFRLVGAGSSSADRTVDLVTAAGDRLAPVVRRIRYADFEPRGDRSAAEIPPAVSAAVEPFARQLLEGNDRLPSLDVFCYGNEAHYSLGFRNHPALLRIDWAPPDWGGMIDLEYVGVSNYEADRHPAPQLDAIRALLLDLGMEVDGEPPRIHARYDKERSSGASDLTRKAEAVLRLAPHLMDLDWTIGSLPLDEHARRRVAATWARVFRRWGALPFDRLLTRDRRAVLQGVESGPLGAREIPWSGAGPCPDGPARTLPAEAIRSVLASARELGVDELPGPGDASDRACGQVRLEEEVLRPIRRAVARGEVVVEGGRLSAARDGGSGREHEAVRFARILSEGGAELEHAAAVASGMAPLERIVRFRTTGTVDGREVQRARLESAGEVLQMLVMRDELGIARLGALREESRGTADPDPAVILRRLDCPTAAPAPEDKAVAARAALAALGAPRVSPASPPASGRPVIRGTAASPGRVAGLLLTRPRERPAADFDGAVLAAPSLGPEDNAALYRAAGIVSTGGAVLSHAAMVARELRKPALFIDGRWSTGRDDGTAGRCALLVALEECREEERRIGGRRVRIRRDFVERELELRDGDLVVLDADESVLHVLGHAPAALGLHECLQALSRADRRLAAARGDVEVLARRGDRLRARRRLERQLTQLHDAATAAHAVHELLAGDPFEAGADAGERAGLLGALLANPAVGGCARDLAREATERLAERFESARERALAAVPGASTVHELLVPRARAWGFAEALEVARETLRGCGLSAPPGARGLRCLEDAVIARLGALRAELAAATAEAVSRPGLPVPGRLLRRVDFADEALGTPPEARARLAGARLAVAVAGRASRERAAGRRILRAADGGSELFREIGWKAANLAEVARLSGESAVPRWFALTHAAFAEVLNGPAVSGGTLRDRIRTILHEPGIPDAVRALRIRAAWEEVRLPGSLVAEVLGAYAELGEDAPVAVRSSAREEDSETAARAGEFDTFLCVRGRVALLRHVKWAWAGFWTDRAIRHRAVTGAEADIGGGVLVQRMVDARVSGVVQTVNTVTGNLGEIIVNAGLGLGEGVVSGSVAADRFAVEKPAGAPGDPIRYRCVAADKAEQVVPNLRAGRGTVRVPTVSHQRLRPALDYVELDEVVRTVLGLEAAYGHPLDVEFAFEGIRLRILQVRPVAALETAVRESLRRHPLGAGREPGEAAA